VTARQSTSAGDVPARQARQATHADIDVEVDRAFQREFSTYLSVRTNI
jgi:hypothetical protein